MDPIRLRRRILRNRKCSTVFRLGKEVFVVGGYLRDLVRKDAHSKDVDFAVAGSVRPLAVSVAHELGGTVVELKKERMTRVALKGGVTLDFSRMEGGILDDLRRRDFTINSMAWSPSSGLLDPAGGIKDIKQGIIRSISDDNLKRDPLRLLRAYRFRAEFGMSIERRTKASIKRLAPRIRQSASERITLEFFKLLNSQSPAGTLHEALSDGVLNKIISLNNRQLGRNIKSISLLDRNIDKLHERLYLKVFSQGLTFRGLLRLEALLLGTEPAAARLSMSRDIGKRVEVSGKLYPAYKEVSKSNSYDVYNLLSEAGDVAFDLILLTGRLDLIIELKRFERIRRGGLLTSEEIISLTGIGEGPRLGRILKEIERQRFARKISGKGAARKRLMNRATY